MIWIKPQRFSPVSGWRHNRVVILFQMHAGQIAFFGGAHFVQRRDIGKLFGNGIWRIFRGHIAQQRFAVVRQNEKRLELFRQRDSDILGRIHADGKHFFLVDAQLHVLKGARRVQM